MLAFKQKGCYRVGVMTTTEFGAGGNESVAQLLRYRGYRVEASSYLCPFDLLVNGCVRVEVKRAAFSRNRWVVNIQRHNGLNEQGVDIYIIRLEKAPGLPCATHLIMKAPLGKPTVTITFRSLLTKYAKHFNDYAVIDAVAKAVKK